MKKKSTNAQIPPEPTPNTPPPGWKHSDLYERIKRSIVSLPIHFATETYIEGISATDIFTLNSALGATIEEQVVETLNRIRNVWDPDGTYSLYGFERKPQSFPDVVLRRLAGDTSEDDAIIMGIELKGWYLLSKEGEPSFRYQVTPAACAPADLLVCVPWALRNVLSGHPRVLAAYMKPAEYAARLRNYYWRYRRTTSSDPTITPPPGPITPYPAKADRISDRAVADGGGNFGRYARTGIMDEYLATTLATPLCGIPARSWLEFFKLFTQSAGRELVLERIRTLRSGTDHVIAEDDADIANAILNVIERHVTGEALGRD